MLAGVVNHAIEILHNQENVSELDSVFAGLGLMSTMQVVNFYQKIALETFQYEAEFGSITALVWAITLAEQMSEFVKNQEDEVESASKMADYDIPFEQYTFLVDIGLTMYNYVRDAKHRYAILDKEQQQSMKLFDRYNQLVKNLSVRDSDKLHLEYLADLIYVAQVTSTITLKQSEMLRLKAMEKSERVLRHENDSPNQHPSILIGLHFYHTAKLHYINRDYSLAWNEYHNAVNHLKSLENCTGSTASYYYDVIYGKLFL